MGRKAKMVVSPLEAAVLRRAHIVSCLPVVYLTEASVLRRSHLFRLLVKRYMPLRVSHLAKVKPGVLLRSRLCHDAVLLMERDRAKYRVDEEIPERIILKLNKVREEPDPLKAAEYARRAWKSMEIHCLYLWSIKRVPGPA